MTTEFVLILGLYAFILLGAFLGDRGPIATFKGSAPRLAAKVERDIAVGKNFTNKKDGRPTIFWQSPEAKTGAP
jgi:hypothetical protein